MGRPLDKAAAASYGELVNAVYEMFDNDKHSLNPMPSAKFGPNWSFLAWIDMTDFLFGFSDPRFYGVVPQSADPRRALSMIGFRLVGFNEHGGFTRRCLL
jgi:hypothetical protein